MCMSRSILKIMKNGIDIVFEGILFHYMVLLALCRCLV